MGFILFEKSEKEIILKTSDLLNKLQLFSVLVGNVPSFRDQVGISNDGAVLTVMLKTPEVEAEIGIPSEGSVWDQTEPFRVSWSRWYGLLQSLSDKEIRTNVKDDTFYWEGPLKSQKGKIALSGIFGEAEDMVTKEKKSKPPEVSFLVDDSFQKACSLLKSSINFKSFSMCRGILVRCQKDGSCLLYATDGLVLGKATVFPEFQTPFGDDCTFLIPPSLVSVLSDVGAVGGSVHWSPSTKDTIKFQKDGFVLEAGLLPPPDIDPEAEIVQSIGNPKDNDFVRFPEGLKKGLERARLIGSTDEAVVSLTLDECHLLLDYTGQFGELNEKFSLNFSPPGKITIQMRLKELLLSLSVGSEFLFFHNNPSVFCSREKDGKSFSFLFLAGSVG